MTDAWGNLIPARWVLPAWARTYEQEIIVNWLEIELSQREMRADSRIMLQQLRGWRNREVCYYIKGWDWTARIYGVGDPEG